LAQEVRKQVQRRVDKTNNTQNPIHNKPVSSHNKKKRRNDKKKPNSTTLKVLLKAQSTKDKLKNILVYHCTICGHVTALPGINSNQFSLLKKTFLSAQQKQKQKGKKQAPIENPRKKKQKIKTLKSMLKSTKEADEQLKTTRYNLSDFLQSL